MSFHSPLEQFGLDVFQESGVTFAENTLAYVAKPFCVCFQNTITSFQIEFAITS